MKLTIRLSLLISATALFASACTPVPMENQTTPYGSGSYNTTPAPVTNTNVSTGPVPEAGPLSEANYAANTPAPAAATPQYPAATSPQVPVAAANPTPIGTVPQVPAATNTNVANNTYQQPAATTGSNSSPYGSYAANTTGTTTYDYSGSNAGTNGGANSYTSYGNTSTANNNTYAAANTGGNTYYSGSNAAATTASGSASGNAAVQVFATVSQAKAERIRQDIASQGMNAIVDQVDGLFKVRVPYATSSEARANLTRVRHVSGTPGAFVTTR